MDRDSFRFDHSPYERPNLHFRCGRAALWGVPCPRGPSASGACGGEVACFPVKRDSRWVCRRPDAQGGRCPEGPEPDGRCAHRMPPCQPQTTTRRKRGTLTLLAVLTIIGLIGATFHFDASAYPNLSSLNPGPLSGLHGRFTADQGCASCHAAHGRIGSWLTALASPSSQTELCSSCHQFSGPATAPHNFQAASALAQHQSAGPTQTACTMCHLEHHGDVPMLLRTGDGVCQTCHMKKFTAFGVDHPEFSAQFPYAIRTAVEFDHTAHFGAHFSERKTNGPAITCISCHRIDQASRVVPLAGFETCAACHGDDIVKRDLTVFTMPELSIDEFAAIDQGAIAGACGPRSADEDKAYKDAKGLIDSTDKKAKDDFQSISDQPLTPLGKLLTGAAKNDIADLDPKDPPAAALADLMRDLAKGGAAALGKAAEAKLGQGRAAALFAGLTPDLVRRAACAWSSNAEFKVDAPLGGGWYADGLSLKYRPAGHGDPVVRAWIDAALGSPADAASGANKAWLADLRAAVLDRKSGPGACVKCHAVSDPAATGTDEEKLAKAGPVLAVKWDDQIEAGSEYVNYTHLPHINLLGPAKGCDACHATNKDAHYPQAFDQVNPHHFESNFSPIRRAQCSECHAPARVRDDCMTCHEYHRNAGLKKIMMAQPNQG